MGKYLKSFDATSVREGNTLQIASTRVESGIMTSDHKSQVWRNGFGAHRSRDEDGRVQAYDHNYFGFVGGYETVYRSSSISRKLKEKR